ncbi:phosphoenolpyruvate synthase [Phormidium tenue FACHB-886]|nr:phosphoenolpyruvate synthase [Phormidium tenue FACHB-886]
MPDDLYWFDQIQPAQRSLVGDKAFYLALLQQRGCPVIPGVVVASSQLRRFLQQIDWQSPLLTDLPNSSLHVDVNQPRQLQTIARQIRGAIREATVPQEWLVQLEAAVQIWETPGHSLALILRPSFSLPAGIDPTVSHRTKGLLQTQVCRASRSEMAVALKEVWGGLFCARSLLYWQRLGIQLQQINLAVLVQPLWGAIASGEMHGENPLEIQATYGLGMALVQGETIPDRYHIDSQINIQQQLGQKLYAYRIASSLPVSLERYATSSRQQSAPVLSEAQLNHLANLGQQAIATLDTALALEWTLCQLPDKPPMFYFTQATPQLNRSLLSVSKSSSSIAEKHGAPVAASLVGIAASPGIVSAPACIVSTEQGSPLNVPPGSILVAARITPEMLVGLNSIAGILTEQGGATSHGAILARELQIPAVVGVPNVTRLIQAGELLLLDGDRGWVQIGQHSQPRATDDARRSAVISRRFPETTVKDASRRVATQLWVSLSQPSSVAAARLPVAGLGLLRSELMVLEMLEGQSPYQWIQENRQQVLIERLAIQIQQFAAAFAPHPVFYRSLDWRSHELSPETGQQVEANPMLGLRGVFNYQINPAVFEAELAALRSVQQQGYDNLRLILPFVRTVEEFHFCRERVIEAKLWQVEGFQLWIMAEVPSVLLLLPDYVSAGVQGIAIGTNDLTQLLLGVDRDHPQLATAFNPEHPAVLRAIQQLIQTAKQLNIPCHLCGQVTPAMVEAAVSWGVTGISVEPSQVELMREAIARAE